MGSGARKQLNTHVSGQKQSLIVVVGRKCELGTQKCVERFGNANGDLRMCARVQKDDTGEKWLGVVEILMKTSPGD